MSKPSSTFLASARPAFESLASDSSLALEKLVEAPRPQFTKSKSSIEMQDLFHKLRGGAGFLGLAEVSEMAKQIEAAFARLNQGLQSALEWDLIAEFIPRLQAELNRLQSQLADLSENEDD